MEGRVVHFVIPESREGQIVVRNGGECRAATVVRVFDRDPSGGNGCANLTIFTDGNNDKTPSAIDLNEDEQLFRRETSVLYDKAQVGRTWHWPQECLKRTTEPAR